MQTGAVSWPPSWGASPERPAAGHSRPYPPPGWPSKAQLDYTRELVTLSLLLLAIPFFLRTLAHDPDRLARAGLPRL